MPVVHSVADCERLSLRTFEDLAVDAKDLMDTLLSNVGIPGFYSKPLLSVLNRGY